MSEQAAGPKKREAFEKVADLSKLLNEAINKMIEYQNTGDPAHDGWLDNFNSGLQYAIDTLNGCLDREIKEADEDEECIKRT